MLCYEKAQFSILVTMKLSAESFYFILRFRSTLKEIDWNIPKFCFLPAIFIWNLKTRVYNWIECKRVLNLIVPTDFISAPTVFEFRRHSRWRRRQRSRPSSRDFVVDSNVVVFAARWRRRRRFVGRSRSRRRSRSSERNYKLPSNLGSQGKQNFWPT